MKAILAVTISFFLSACAGFPDVISASAPGGINITNSTVVTDLVSAKFNLDEAVRIGVLDANDPAPYCLGDVLKRAGIGGAAPDSFKPKYDGVASAGAVAYIEAQKLKRLAGQIKVDSSCEALVGRIVIDSANVTRKALTPSITGLLK